MPAGDGYDCERIVARNDLGARDRNILSMDENAGRSCWGWTVWALAFCALAFAVVYLLGGFDVTPAIAR
jgi:hypothetical protein